MARYLLLEDGGKIELEGVIGSFIILEGVGVWQLRRKGSPAGVQRVTSITSVTRIASVLSEDRVSDVDDVNRITSVADVDRITAPKGGE